MKELLLINPPQKHTISGNLPQYVDESRGNIPPLGLLYTASAVENNTDWNVRLCDMSAGEILTRGRYGNKPDLVGITATTFTLLDVLDVAKQVKDIWGVPVVVGGIHPTIYPKETAALPNIDCVVTGESEITFPKMIDYIALGGVKIVEGEMPSMDELPIPAYHLLDYTLYYSVIGKSGRLTSMFTSRGCPYQCIFCHRKTMGKRFRARTAEQVVDEIKLVAAMGINEILFYDDTFTVDSNRVKAICQMIIDSGIKVQFDIRARVNHINKEILGYLQKAGCKRIHYGVEASSDRVLEQLHKGITIHEVINTFKITREVGIEILAYFIIGSPTETRDDITNTIRLAKQLKPDYCHFGIMTPYPATPLYEKGLENKLYDDYWLAFARTPSTTFEAPYWNELDKKELWNMLNTAYRSFYWRPSQIVKETIKTRSMKQLIKKGKGALRMIRRNGNE